MRDGVRTDDGDTKTEWMRGVMKFSEKPEEGDLMNERTRVKGQLPRDKAVTDSSTGKGLRGERQENSWERPNHSDSPTLLCFVFIL